MKKGKAKMASTRTLACLWAAIAMTGCGSEREDDLASSNKGKNNDQLGERKTDDKKSPEIKIEPISGDAIASIPGSCVAPMRLQVVLNPEDTSTTQTLLTARLEPQCYTNSTPVLRIRVTNTFRLGAPLACSALNVGEFNFQCTGTVQQFVVGGQVVIPVELDTAADMTGFRAEIEFTRLGAENPPAEETTTLNF